MNTPSSPHVWNTVQANAPQALPRPVTFRVYPILAGTHVECHRHARSQFLFARTGVMQVQTAEAILVVPPQFGVWVPSGVDHSLRAIEDIELESLYIEDEQLIPAVRQSARVVLVDPLARDFIHHACCEIGSHYDPASKDGRRVRVLLDMLEDLPDTAMNLPQPRDPALLTMCRAFQADPTRPDGLNEWADRIGIPMRALSRQFLAETGLAFEAWRSRLRLMAAITLLRQGRSVAEAASGVGCSSQSTFTYAFRETFGVSPSRFEIGRIGDPRG